MAEQNPKKRRGRRKKAETTETQPSILEEKKSPEEPEQAEESPAKESPKEEKVAEKAESFEKAPEPKKVEEKPKAEPQKIMLQDAARRFVVNYREHWWSSISRFARTQNFIEPASVDDCKTLLRRWGAAIK